MRLINFRPGLCPGGPGWVVTKKSRKFSADVHDSDSVATVADSDADTSEN